MFRAVFHHEDEANFSMLSYEARIHHVEITGAPHGSARQCVRCAPGTRVSEDGAFCVKCPPGFYSKGGTPKCTQCPAGTFSNKVRANFPVDTGHKLNLHNTVLGVLCMFNLRHVSTGLVDKQLFTSTIVTARSYFLKQFLKFGLSWR